MGWQISLVKNTVFIPDSAVKDVKEALSNTLYGEDPDDFLVDNQLNFEPDHMEHMDYMWNTIIHDAFLNHKINGIIAFSSTEGDNKGKNWGYKFTDGVLSEISGKVEWL